MVSITDFVGGDVAAWWPQHIDESAWLEHTPFAAWIMGALKPNLFVELGAHRGVSYFAFCQAASLLPEAPRCFAVDTWEGDPHTGPYETRIFERVAALNSARYASFSTLMRCSFAEALEKFKDKSIDLLHIDGFHTYDAVSEDFRSWLPKMSDRGIILFHDTMVKERDFGVWRLWDEVSRQFPGFSFTHGHGLGVLAVGKNLPHEVKFLFNSNEDSPDIQDILKAFNSLGSRVSRYYTSRERAGRRRIFADTTRDREWPATAPRHELLLAGAQKTWQILEIGPSHRPVADKKSGWQTFIVDHASKQDLIKKYENDQSVDIRQIEDVDFVWSGGDLSDLIPIDMHGSFDILIASHVIEHFPDPIGVLVAAEKFLNPEKGIISLAVPDKRLCFDFFRPLSTSGKFLEAHHNARTRHSAADLFDATAYLATLGPDIAWGWRETAAMRPRYMLADAYNKFREAAESEARDYQDCHAWMFTPASFELLILELSGMGILDWHVQSMLPQDGVEFIVHLARGRAIFDSPEAFEQRRVELLQQVQRDLYRQMRYYFGDEKEPLRKKSEEILKRVWRRTVPADFRRKIAQLRGKLPRQSVN